MKPHHTLCNAGPCMEDSASGEFWPDGAAGVSNMVFTKNDHRAVSMMAESGDMRH